MHKEYLIARKKRESLLYGKFATHRLIEGDNAEGRCGPGETSWRST